MGEFLMPSLGADMDAGTITEWRVQPGDTVHRGDIIAVVDTEKADVEVEVFEDGVVEELLVPAGEQVAVGTPLARLGALAPAAPVHAPPPAAPRPAAPPAVLVPAPAVSPVVRRHATELGVDLAAVTGTGPSGRITRADVERAAAPRPVTPSRSTRRITPRARHLAARRG
ncbi:MAG TPA: biotin/lipoyl-containing protein, partial [Acidimicrobiia bacterium]|nr:biotin/lipoyl-containing protein [Acidimicrobiia bacterium]